MISLMSNEKEQAAFLAGFLILKELEKAGLKYMSVELFSDGSGCLHMPKVDYHPNEIELMTKLLKSSRFQATEDGVKLFSCGGFLSYAKEINLIK